MSRIIAGSARGRTVLVPKSGTRPTSDRVRESLFSMLDARIDSWDDLRVLDLFAGSGALGLEAISRGAVSASLVDNSVKAVAVINRNVSALDFASRTQVVKATAGKWVASANDQRFSYSLVFLDPPYDMQNEDVESLLSELANSGVLAHDALVVVERSTRGEQFEFPLGLFDAVVERTYGDTSVKIGLFVG